MRTIYDSLVVYGDDMTIQPGLAESWTISDDGLQYVLNLRKDVKFHCGEPFTSEAVKYTIDKIMDPDEHSPIAYLYQEIENVEIPDDYTVVINMKTPNALLLENLAHYNFGLIICPVCSEQYGEDFGGTTACGLGPFKFESKVPGSKVTVTRNEEYTWGPSCRSNTGPPYLDSITWRIIPEEASRLIELEVGNIDLARDISPESLVELVEAEGVDPLLYKPLNNWWFCFRIKDGSERSPFTADINIRKAVDYAIDKEGIIRSFMPGAIFFQDRLYIRVFSLLSQILYSEKNLQLLIHISAMLQLLSFNSLSKLSKSSYFSSSFSNKDLNSILPILAVPYPLSLFADMPYSISKALTALHIMSKSSLVSFLTLSLSSPILSKATYKR
jgi:ABC-type transport system substrate-binding protein